MAPLPKQPQCSTVVLNLSTGAFVSLFDSLKARRIELRYELLCDGKGKWTGN